MSPLKTSQTGWYKGDILPKRNTPSLDAYSDHHNQNLRYTNTNASTNQDTTNSVLNQKRQVGDNYKTMEHFYPQKFAISRNYQAGTSSKHSSHINLKMRKLKEFGIHRVDVTKLPKLSIGQPHIFAQTAHQSPLSMLKIDMRKESSQMSQKHQIIRQKRAAHQPRSPTNGSDGAASLFRISRYVQPVR